MSSLQSLGRHIYRVESDIIYSKIYGSLTLEEAKQFVELYAKVYAEYGYILLLLDLSESTTVDIEARKLFVEWSKTHYLAGLAGFGGTAINRVMTTLIVRAANLVTRNAPQASFFKTEEAARQWLDRQRAVALAPKSRGGGAKPSR